MKNLRKILLISDSDRTGEILSEYLIEMFHVICVSDFKLERFIEDSVNFDYIIMDYILLNDFKTSLQSDDFYTEKLALIKSHYPDARLICLVPAKKIEEVGRVLELGIDNLIHWPASKEIVLHRFKVEEERTTLREVIKDTSQLVMSSKKPFETTDENFSKELQTLEKVAKSRSTILITGESGTGKSLLAKYIHQLSPRQDKAFIEVHCGAIAETLVESELFGHEKGSFTGAMKRKIGKFELANQGSIFLDEIGTISHGVQVKLLQVIQERFIQRVGGESNIPLDLRIIAATNTSLKEAVSKKEFREDLYFRLNVFHIQIPPLRQRKKDIPILCQLILAKFNKLYGNEIKGVSDEVLHIFQNYDWPGNVRELENILERAYVLEDSEMISHQNIPSDLIPAAREFVEISPLFSSQLGLVEARKAATEAFEKKYITELLLAHKGKVAKMAKEAKVSVRQIHKLMAKHHIKSKDFAIQLEDSEHDVQE